MVTGVVTNYLDGLTTNMEKGHALSSSQLDENDELWLRILQEVSNKNNTAVRSSLIVLGNERSGKSSLLARLMGGSRKPMNSVLEYNYLQIHADASASYVYQLGGGANGLLGPTDSATLPVWILDGRDEMTPMLKFAFPSSLAKCVVILCASLEQPGNVLLTLRRWYRLLDEQIRQHYSADDIFQAQQMQVRFWQEYVEPIESSLHSTATLVDINGPSNIGSMVGDQGPSSPLLLPPEKGILEENCGATLFVVITKSDLHTEFTNEQLDKVQYHVRQFCLRHGAALFYTSSKEDLNTQMLLKYIAHRIYALPFTTPAYIVEKDSIFVPMGWDSEQKLSIVKESLGYGSGQVPLLAQQTDTSSFTNKISGEKEIEADDEQVFLNKLSSITHDSANSGQLRSSGQQSPRQGGKGPVGGQAGGGDNNNTMLANFFSSLLTKDIQRPSSTHSNKSGHSPTHPTTASSIDAELHFKKMLANKRSGSEMTEDVSKTIIDEKQKDLEDNEDEEEKEDRDSEEEMEENNEDFEDAPDVDATSINSSSKNVTPRTDSDDVKVLASIEEQTTLIVSETLEQEK